MPFVYCCTRPSIYQLKYDFLIVALGLKINYHKIAGLPEALEDPNSPVATNYSPKYVQKTFQLISNYKGGNAIFTMPPLPIKCPGAPQKIMYLAEDYFRKVCRVFCVCACKDDCFTFSSKSTHACDLIPNVYSCMC